MRNFAFFAALTVWLGFAIAVSAQHTPDPILTNSGTLSAAVRAQAGTTVLYGAVGQATSVVVAQNNQKVLYHGILHPLILTATKLPVKNVSVYPNPTAGPLSVLWENNDDSPTHVVIYDRNGSPLNILNYSPDFALENLPAGTYSLQFRNGDILLGVAEIVLIR